MKPLTENQLAFVKLVAKGVNQTEAYRQAYPNCKAKSEVVSIKACQLAKTTRVVEALAKARDRVEQGISYGLVDALREAEEARAMAETQKQSSAMTAAITLKSKLLGLMAEDRKNDRTPLSDISDDQLQQHIDAAAREAGYVISKAAAKA